MDALQNVVSSKRPSLFSKSTLPPHHEDRNFALLRKLDGRRPIVHTPDRGPPPTRRPIFYVRFFEYDIANHEDFITCTPWSHEMCDGGGDEIALSPDCEKQRPRYILSESDKETVVYIDTCGLSAVYYARGEYVV